MSYDIIHSIKITDDNKVIVKSASSNVVPRTPYESESSYLTRILQNGGQEALNISIMEAYASGSFQGGSNKYTRALEVLLHMPEYKAFDWRGNWDEYKKNIENKEAYHSLLLKAFSMRLPREKYVITKNLSEGTKAYFYQRKGAHFCKWYYEKTKAKIFRFCEDAEATRKCFTNSENWKIEIA